MLILVVKAEDKYREREKTSVFTCSQPCILFHQKISVSLAQVHLFMVCLSVCVSLSVCLSSLVCMVGVIFVYVIWYLGFMGILFCA